MKGTWRGAVRGSDPSTGTVSQPPLARGSREGNRRASLERNRVCRGCGCMHADVQGMFGEKQREFTAGEILS